MKSLTNLLESLLQDCSRICCTTTIMDVSYIHKRVKAEGDSFITITLPSFSQAFERSLEIGRIDLTAFRGFGMHKGIPRFLSGILCQVFDDTGSLRQYPSFDAISCIRQICLFTKKIHRPCERFREVAAVEGYCRVEDELSRLGGTKDFQDRINSLSRISSILYSGVFSKILSRIDSQDIIPKHGPGTTSDRTLYNKKYVWSHWSARLDAFFPASEYCYNSYTTWLDETASVLILNPEQEQPVRVVFVPKTMKTPRVIGVEPVYNQYIQQALLRQLVPLIETDPLLKGHINFTDQGVNQRSCHLASLSKDYSTLDLSEASDRVHYDLARSVFASCPLLWDMIDSCRTKVAELGGKDGKFCLKLSKFASMGSALCFPVESMVFFSILVYSELKRLNCRVSVGAIRSIVDDLLVYGDDLIIPRAGTESAIRCLSDFGLKVNVHKSFVNSHFRESCGSDYYAGYSVKPVYLRSDLPTSRRDASAYASLCATANQLYLAGYYGTSYRIAEYLNNILPLPYGQEGTAHLAYINPLWIDTCKRKVDEDLSRILVKAPVISAAKVHDHVNGNALLMKSLLKLESRLSEKIGASDQGDLETSPVRGDLRLKSRWSPAY